MYATDVPYPDDSKSDNDNNNDTLSQLSIIIISVVISFVIGSIMTGFSVWFWMRKEKIPEKQELLA